MYVCVSRIQGILDPLNDASARAKQIKDNCNNVEVVELPLGHCPHDEDPQAFNTALIEWLGRVAPGTAAQIGSQNQNVPANCTVGESV